MGVAQAVPSVARAVGHGGPIEVSELAQQSLTMRTDSRKGHHIGHDDLVASTDLLQGWLDVLGGFSSSQLDEGGEHLPNLCLLKTSELGVQCRVQKDRQLELRLGRDGPRRNEQLRPPRPAQRGPSVDPRYTHHRDIADVWSGQVTLSFALRNPEVADCGLPQVGRYVDQVTETGLAPTQHTDESGTLKARPSRATRRYLRHCRSAAALPRRGRFPPLVRLEQSAAEKP